MVSAYYENGLNGNFLLRCRFGSHPRSSRSLRRRPPGARSPSAAARKRFFSSPTRNGLQLHPSPPTKASRQGRDRQGRRRSGQIARQAIFAPCAPYCLAYDTRGNPAMKALPPANVLFKKLEYDVGTTAGAREVFQSLITDLVAVHHPTANEVAGPGGGDWGIDTYVGRLDDDVVVWQSKFFLEWKGEDQRGQVRDSFNQLMKQAQKEGLTVKAWTLCVPCILPPGEQKWFDGWKTRTARKHNVEIEMWNGAILRRQLMKPDASDVRQQYFEQEPLPEAPPVVPLLDVRPFDEALFVRQLEEAGYVETDAARGLFFAAEALVRTLAAAGDKAGASGLRNSISRSSTCGRRGSTPLHHAPMATVAWRASSTTCCKPPLALLIQKASGSVLHTDAASRIGSSRTCRQAGSRTGERSLRSIRGRQQGTP